MLPTYLSIQRARAISAALLSAVAALTLLAGAGPASARTFPAISGKLSKPGFSIVALAYNGHATVARPKHGAFSIHPSAARVTLQLVSARGRYAGPVIVSATRSRVVEGVKAGAKLGHIVIHDGYATLKHRIATRKALSKWTDAGRWAQARRGVPLGNGRNLGLVRSKVHNGPSGPGGDSARSGVPNAFSVDPAGLGHIDALTPSGGVPHAARAQAAGASDSSFSIFSQLLVPFSADAVNANAGNIGATQIDAGMERWLSLNMQVIPGTQTELDCGALTYCSPGGSGHEYASPGSGVTPLCSPSAPGCNYNEGPAFPACCAAGDGLGILPQSADSSPARGFGLLPEASSAQIGSGDVLVQRVTNAGATTEVPGTLPFVFTSEPALKSWSSGSDAATVTYPVTDTAPGTQGNPWVIGGGSGDVVITFTFWRPQRAGITGAGEAASMDIGQLHYISRPVPAQGGGSVMSCPQSSYSTTASDMVVGSSGTEGFVGDMSEDAPSNPANTLSYSLDLTNCAAANGQTLASDEQIDVDVSGRSPGSGDNAGVNYAFRIR
jgi:hypothetical protein